MRLQRQLLAGVLALLGLACSPALALAEDLVIRIKSSAANLLRSPDYDAEVIRTVAGGEQFVAVTTYNDFYLVKDQATESFLYVAFLDAEELIDALPEEVLVSGTMPVPEMMDLSYWHVSPNEEYKLKLRSRADGEMLTAHNGKKYPAEYSYNEDYRPVIDGRQLVRDAMVYMGTEYVSGGTTKRGIDCSGLTQVCLGKQGIDVVHRSSLQALEGKYVHYDELKPGDLVFFRDDVDNRYLSHVGIYVGRNQFIHASQSRGGVTITSLNDKYFKAHYAFARRL